MRAFLVFILAGSILCLRLLAADPQFQGPVLGYYTDPGSHGVHALTGLPGGATSGPAITTDFDSLWVGPDNRTALGLKQGMLFLVPDVRDTPSRLPLTAWNGPVDSVVWARDASGAAIYSAAGRSFRTATDLLRNPVVNREIDLTAGGAILSLHISPKPWNVAAVVRTESRISSRTPERTGALHPPSSLLYLMANDGIPVAVAGLLQAGPMDFSADGLSLYVADIGAKQLRQIGIGAPQSIENIQMNLPGGVTPADFTDFAVSSDGHMILALQQGTRSVCGIDINSGSTVFCSSLDFAPAGMRLLSGSLYLLDSPGDRTGPIWILDSRAGNTFFVPRGGQQ